MPVPEWTPQEIAEFDQQMAEASDVLDQVIDIVRADAADLGKIQAICNAGHNLEAKMDEDTRISLLLAAIWRLILCQLGRAYQR